MEHKSSAPHGTYSKGRAGRGSASASARGYTPSGSRRDRASEEPKQPNRPSRRGAKQRGMPMGIIIAVAIIAVLALILILTLGQRAPTHMLPKVTPPETADAATGAEA